MRGHPVLASNAAVRSGLRAAIVAWNAAIALAGRLGCSPVGGVGNRSLARIAFTDDADRSNAAPIWLLLMCL